MFTDLDGTLLDHHTYSHDAAEPVLARLRRLGVPLVLASSKTAPEMIPLRDKLGFASTPLICENGAGVVEGQTPPARTEWYRLRSLLDHAAGRAHFEGFGDMSVARVAEVTGLRRDEAALAAMRAFSEPGLWHGPPGSEPGFIAALAGLGVSARRGGRFLTLGFGATKADRMAQIAGRHDAALTVALGDAPNDIEMLEQADYGLIVRNPDAPALPVLHGETAGKIRRSRASGPQGWADMLGPLLTELGYR
ncbi:MAG: HAD-IIB family hydrolase [Rhodobacteraceae bacterium]|nr:HAD-IIB family hydrolase [Paracoccaceae bacterium]